MLLPYRSEADPEVQGEGSIDPLGLLSLADRLAEWILPGLTARMWRPRFLTAIVATAVIVEPLEEALAKDGATPPWLVFEWYYVEPMARLEDTEGQLRRIPGIDKGRQAVRDKVPMNPDRYLKTPKVFGFHGVYKRLASHVGIVDNHLSLGENGYRLLRLWEQEQNLPGFSDWESKEGDGPRMRCILYEAVQKSLETGQTERHGSWPGATYLVEHLSPHNLGPGEAQFLWGLLLDSQAEPRGEIFRILRSSELLQLFSRTGSERQLVLELRSRASNELRRRLEAIEAYEEFCRLVGEAFERVRFLSTDLRPSPVVADDLQNDARVSELASSLGTVIRNARHRLTGSPIADGFEALVQKFEEVRNGGDLFHSLWDHHVDVQKRKPPEGKRPWFEQMVGGGLIVRPPYRFDGEPAPWEEYVHPYRLSPVESFIRDLTLAN